MDSNTLHQLAELFAHHAEVALYLLHKESRILYKVDLLDIHLILNKVFDSADTLLLLVVDGRNHQLGQRLTNLDVNFTTESQSHGCYLLSDIHAGFKFGIDGLGISHWITLQMHTLHLSTKVVIKTICIERSKRCNELGNSHQT